MDNDLTHETHHQEKLQFIDDTNWSIYYYIKLVLLYVIEVELLANATFLYNSTSTSPPSLYVVVITNDYCKTTDTYIGLTYVCINRASK